MFIKPVMQPLTRSRLSGVIIILPVSFSVWLCSAAAGKIYMLFVPGPDAERQDHLGFICTGSSSASPISGQSANCPFSVQTCTDCLQTTDILNIATVLVLSGSCPSIMPDRCESGNWTVRELSHGYERVMRGANAMKWPTLTMYRLMFKTQLVTCSTEDISTLHIFFAMVTYCLKLI
jgi:hypothetical protein